MTEPIRWLVVQPDGTVEYRADEPTLEVLQAALDGYIEKVASPMPDTTVFINEEKAGRDGNGLLLNSKASVFLADTLWPGQRIVGPMVVAGMADEHGDITDLTEDQVNQLRKVLE